MFEMYTGLMHIAYLLLLLSFAEVTAASTFQVVTNQDGSYQVLVNNRTWLTSADTAFYGNGRIFSVTNKSMWLNSSSTSDGSDMFGAWTSASFTYDTGVFRVNLTIQRYLHLSAAVFTQTYLDAVENTSAKSSDAVISKFPSFKLTDITQSLGFVAYGGDLVGYSSMTIGRLQQSTTYQAGMRGGPVLIFDNTSNAIIISPLSQFMSASSSVDRNRQINWGIMGSVNSVPRNYSLDFILFYSSRGINQVVRDWGRYLTTLYRKSTDHREQDLTVQYLGYWTNNGAYYYYNTEKGRNYETTIVDFVSYMKNINVPFKYLEFDSWWYSKGPKGGTLTWEPQPDVFPGGFRNLSDQTRLPFGCHNRYWDAQTSYAKYNGGSYNFIQDKKTGYAVPDDYQFWLDLFNKTQTWGNFILYEQDWLNRETDNNAVLQSDLFIGRRWLTQMGKAAQTFGITIQYCLSYCRHILQSLEIPAVTQARITRDYEPGGPTRRQWNIGITAILADSLHLAPFKDTFWTTENQPGNPYNLTEPHVRLENIVATLSTGPVGPGDGIGFINRTLLMRCCDVTGRILKPSQALTAIDDEIKRKAFGSHYQGPDGEVYTTFTTISNLFFGIIMAANLSNNYSLTPGSAWPTVQFPASLAFSELEPRAVFNLSTSQPLTLGRHCTVNDPCLYYTSPLLHLLNGNQVLVLGELDKWVPVSGQRISDIKATDFDVIVRLIVQPREIVTFTFLHVTQGQFQEVTCDNSQSSRPAAQTAISVLSGTCTLG